MTYFLSPEGAALLITISSPSFDKVNLVWDLKHPFLNSNLIYVKKANLEELKIIYLR